MPGRNLTRGELLERVPPKDRVSLSWSAFGYVEKYSPDQEKYAHGMILRDRSVSKRQITLAGPKYRKVLAEHLHAMTAPEDGTAEAAGNVLVTTGLNIITKLLIGTAVTGSVLSGPATGFGYCGVGSTTTPAVAGDTVLGADTTSPNGTVGCFYQSFDSSFCTQSNGVITGQATYASANANMAWQEWGWGTSTVAVNTSTSSTMASLTSGTETLWNHKIAALGTKASGAAWVFTTTVTLA